MKVTTMRKMRKKVTNCEVRITVLQEVRIVCILIISQFVVVGFTG